MHLKPGTKIFWNLINPGLVGLLMCVAPQHDTFGNNFMSRDAGILVPVRVLIAGKTRITGIS